MKQCVLPVAKPNITHTPVIANMLSILQTNPNTESWIANHFVNIFINNDGIFDNFYDRNMFFYGCPWLQVNQIRREVVLRICHRITDYVKALLAEGFYVYSPRINAESCFDSATVKPSESDMRFFSTEKVMYDISQFLANVRIRLRHFLRSVIERF